MTHIVRPLLLLLTIWMTALPAFGADRVPFRGSVDTVPLVVGFCGPGCLVLDITGTGHATHMGRVEVAGPSEVSVITGVQTGTSTLTAANGDTIVISITGTAEFEGPSPNDLVIFQGTWEVVDGTGRFEDAVGSGTYAGTATGPSGSFVMEGAINRPGSEH